MNIDTYLNTPIRLSGRTSVTEPNNPEIIDKHIPSITAAKNRGQNVEYFFTELMIVNIGVGLSRIYPLGGNIGVARYGAAIIK